MKPLRHRLSGWLLLFLCLSLRVEGGEAEARQDFEKVFKNFPRTFWDAATQWLKAMDRPRSPGSSPDTFIRTHRLVDAAFRQDPGAPDTWIVKFRMLDEAMPHEYWVFEFKHSDRHWRTFTGVKHFRGSISDLYKADMFSISMKPFVETAMDQAQSETSDRPERRLVAGGDPALPGYWRVIALDHPEQGRVDEKSMKGRIVLEFRAETVRAGNGLNDVELKYRTDRAQAPAALDQYRLVREQEFVTRSIYRFNSNQCLEIYSALGPGLPCPNAFPADRAVGASYMLLRRLTQDEVTAFVRGPVPEDARPHLERLKQLGAKFDVDRDGRIRTVMLMGAKVSDADLASLHRLGKLVGFIVMGGEITDQGVEHLLALPDLEVLHLDATGVTDAGVRRLTALTRLRTLSLALTRITDASVDSLAAMKSLTRLEIGTTLISAQGARRLRELLPGCKVIQ